MKILINALIQNRKKTLTFSAASIFYTLFLLYVLTLFSETFGDILNLFPKQLQVIAGFGDDLSTAGFLNGEFMHLIGPIIVGAFGITIGSTLIASEEENKTIDQFLALSISRNRYYIEKYFSLVISLIILTTIIGLTLQIGVFIYDINLSLTNIFYAIFGLFIFGLSCGSISFLGGEIFAKNSTAAMIGAGIAILGYVLDSVYKTVNSLEFVKHISLHYYYNNNGLIVNGVDITDLSVLLGIIVFSFSFGIIVFNKRDIKS